MVYLCFITELFTLNMLLNDYHEIGGNTHKDLSPFFYISEVGY
jgi:hypothetical protein